MHPVLSYQLHREKNWVNMTHWMSLAFVPKNTHIDESKLLTNPLVGHWNAYAVSHMSGQELTHQASQIDPAFPSVCRTFRTRSASRPLPYTDTFHRISDGRKDIRQIVKCVRTKCAQREWSTVTIRLKIYFNFLTKSFINKSLQHSKSEW